MAPSELIRHFTFHDSGVSYVEVSEDNKTISFQLELSNYMQPGFKNGDSELIMGTLRFSSVSRVEATPELRCFPWGEDFDGEILRVSLLPDSNESKVQGVEFVIHTIDYPTRRRDILVIKVFAVEVEWITDLVEGKLERCGQGLEEKGRSSSCCS